MDPKTAPKRKRPERASAVAAAKKLRVALADGNDDDGGAEEVNDQNYNKVQFVHKPYKSNTTLLSMIDDGLYLIFNRLTLNDLCSVAQTCQHLQKVCSEYFMQRHKSKVLIIDDVTPTGELIVGPDEEYIDIFATTMQNVTLGKQSNKMKYKLNCIKQDQSDWQSFTKPTKWKESNIYALRVGLAV